MNKWIGTAPKKCDICREAISDTFIDGRTSVGPWANMCPGCHSYCGVGLGTGAGQKYELTGDEWIKVAG
jgi:hypothetical protein